MKKQLQILISILLVSAGGAYSQSCTCWSLAADTTFPIVQMNVGTDTGSAPYYRCNNCSSGAIALPFHFCFYGRKYDTLYINNKGNLSFIHPMYDYSNTGLSVGADTAVIAPFLADVDDIPALFSSIFYQLTPSHLIVQWNTVGYNVFDDDLYDNFQVTITNGADNMLPAGNNVSYCYYTMEWATSDSSGGTGGFNGVPAKIGVVKGDGIHYAQMGDFDLPGYIFDGPTDSASGLYWLEHKSLVFNTCVTGDTIGPVLINPGACLNDTVCAGDTLTINALFLCPQQGQTAVISVSAPSISGLTSDTNNSNSVFRISSQIVAQLADTGTHTVTITATDNSTPPLTNSITHTVVIKNCDSTTGINELKNRKGELSIYPDPTDGIFTIQWTTLSTQGKVEVYNMLGEKVYNTSFTAQGSPYTVNLSNQPAGIYLCRVTDTYGNLIGQGNVVVVPR